MNMDFGFGWLIFIVFVISRICKTVNSIPNNLKGDVQNSIKRFYATWHIPALQQVMYQEIEKFPEYEAILFKAYSEQLALLKALAARHSMAIKKTKEIIREQLSSCHSDESLNRLARQFEWIFKVVPELKEGFDAHRMKMYARKTRKATFANLFEKCQTREEIKKRFRRLALLNHPDKGGSKAAMSEIIRQYEESLKNR
jgi:hypothetical protein